MTFTDDDLEDEKQKAIALGADRTLALLARLEAAEAIITIMDQQFPVSPWKNQVQIFLEAWRKAKGDLSDSEDSCGKAGR